MTRRWTRTRMVNFGGNCGKGLAMEARDRHGASRRLFVLALALGIGTFGLAWTSSAGQGLLDGKTFLLETGEKGKPGTDKDTIVFRDGIFRSAACDRYGFGDGPYSSTAEGGTTRFEAVTTSPTKGKMTWKGTVEGDRITVEYTWVDSPHWYKPNPKPLEKWGRGGLAKP